MADNIISNMFGVDPDQLAQQRQQQIYTQSIQQAQLDPYQRASASLYQGGAGVGQIGAQMLGWKAPGQQLAESRKAALAGLDTNDPDSVTKAAQALNASGDTQGAAMLAQHVRDLQKTQVEEDYKKAITQKALREQAGQTKTIETGVAGQPDMRQKMEQQDDGTWKPVGEPYKIGGAGSRAAADAQTFLTEEAVTQNGADYRRTRKLPPAITKADKSRILNSAAAQAKADGNDGEAESLRRLAIGAEKSATTSALGAIEKRSAGIEVGAKKIENDIKTMQDVQAKGSLDIPQFAGRPLNWARKQTGSPDLRAYALATKQVATEYMRMMTGGMLSVAQLHVGAQEDAKGILDENMTIAETKAILPVMIREIQNARQAASDTKAGLMSDIKKIGVKPKESSTGWSAKVLP